MSTYGEPRRLSQAEGTPLPVEAARNQLGHLASIAAEAGICTVVSYHRIPAAAIVPVSALNQLLRLQAERDSKEPGNEHD